MKSPMTCRKMIINRLVRQLTLAVFFVLAPLISGLASAETPAPGGISFNHNTTGFFLDGAHAKESCESCHTQGLFRGTPRDCATCHRPGGRAPGKTATHVPTTASCDSCHRNVSWTPASFQHRTTQGVVQGACNTCHNGATVAGKPARHVPTTASCDSCHKTSSWLPAGYTHALAVPGACASCHNGTRATGKPAAHIPTSASCDSCHAAGVAFAPISVGVSGMHTNMTGPVATRNCSTCHSGSFLTQNAQSKPSTHIPTTAQCDTCHTSTTSWATAARPDHAAIAPSVSGRCSDCHNSVSALGKPTNHIPTAKQCDSCHTNFSAFKPAQMNHIGTVGQCSSCHSGSYNFANAQAKPNVHIPTTAQCDSCHVSGFVTWSPAAMNHAGMTGKCSTCHSGVFLSQNAQTKPVTHIGTAAQCDTCHSSTASWATATFNHAAAAPAVAGRCASCHNSVAALGKPSTHIPTGAQCDSCHANFTSFKPAQMNHSGMTGQCSTCHNGSYLFANALKRPINHIPSTAQCDSCHVSGFVNWSPATMNHSGLNGLCSSCHSGAYLAQNAQIKPVTHVSTSAQCDTCHNSTTSWATAVYAHDASANGRCSTCHNGATALGKPTNHIPASAQCDTCHTGFSAFKPARMSHAGTSGQCSTCHSGSYVFANALAKPVNHIPTISQCDSCHTGGFVAWTPSVMSHTGLQGSCSSCHSGAFIAQNAQIKTPTHISTTAQCDTCHNSTVSWATATFNHAAATPAVSGRCATCHNGASALGKPTNHIPTTAQCDTCHTNTTAFAPATMSHGSTTGPAAAGNCASCHSGTYVAVNAQAKTPTHITTTAQCDTCHRSTTTWAGASYAHAATATGNCSTCHNGATVLGKPATHIPTSTQCDACHTNYTAFKPARMNHAGLTGQCSTCHSGSYAAVNALSKPATHIPTGAQCDTCHVNGFIAFTPGVMSHAGTNSPVAAGNCSTCHSGAYLAQNAQVKSATHISTAAQCDTCHSSTTSWATATFNHTVATPPVSGRCSSCHNGTNALGKPTNHIPTAAQCDTCHTGFVAFAPGLMNHGSTSGPAAAGNCATCHGGAYVAINAQTKTATHIPTTQSCDTCHTTVAWKPTSYSHQGVVAGTCASCHNGSAALGKTATHLPTSASCNVCHTNYNAFAPARMNHAGSTGPVATGNCSTCHTGAYLALNAQVKPATHVSTTAQCDTCHNSTATWTAATYTHDAAAIGRCSTCHNGTTALGKPTTHVPTSAQCSTCHNNYNTFRPATMSHTGTTGPVAVANCSTCHSGSYIAVNALSKPATHIPTTSQCDSCHTRGYAAWSPSVMNHAGLTGQCSTCHSGGYLAQNAQAKTPTHIPTTAQCDTCHNSTISWATATFNHAIASPPATGRCSTCHNGTNALGKPSVHIPTTAQCDTCHKNYTAFAAATMSHAGLAGQCSTCHSGAYVSQNALAKTPNHIQTTAQCDTCHNSTISWATATFNHATASPPATGRCSTCHNGTNALGKPSIHIPTTAQCDTCHKNYTAFAAATMSHAGLAGQCSTCHSGAYVSQNALAKTPNHIQTTAQCDTCHNSTISWATATFNHATASPPVTGRCSTCHNGTNALGKPSNHIPTTTPAGMPGNECSLCHSSTASFGVERMNHGSMQTSCITCHDASATYAGSMEKSTRTANHHGVNAVGKDCSSSGCHKPLGSKGSTYTKWD